MNTIKLKRKSGFTLIELLVVIAIVGILTGFIFVSMNGAVNASKDSRREADIGSLSRSLLAWQANNSTNNFPVSATACNITGTTNQCSSQVTQALGTMLQSLPFDPNGSSYTYQSSGGNDYVITATLSTGQIYTYTYGSGFAKNLGAGSSANSDGPCSVTSGTVNLNTQSCSGRATADAVNFSSTTNTASGSNQITLSTTPTGLAVGDQVLIINLQGTTGNYSNVGQYEVKVIQQINTNTLTLTQNLTNGYDGTTQKIMVQRLPNYTTVNISSGATLTANAWDGTRNGVLSFYASGAVTIAGTLDMNTKGFSGGAGCPSSGCFGTNPGWGLAGASFSGTPSSFVASTTNNNGAGGAGASRGGGAGAAYLNNGNDGTKGPNPVGGSDLNGLHGTIYGSSTLDIFFFGSGGGGGGGTCDGQARAGGAGGAGGGIIFINSGTSITLQTGGVITSNAGNGGNGGCNSWGASGGGGGSGGSIKIIAPTRSISGTVTANAGNGGSAGCSGSNAGGAGGAGSAGIIYQAAN